MFPDPAISRLIEDGTFSRTDAALAQSLLEIEGVGSLSLCLGGLFLGRESRQGEISLFIEDLYGGKYRGDRAAAVLRNCFPDAGEFISSLRENTAVIAPSEISGMRAPLVLDEHGRLYFFRYYDYEKRLAERILFFCSAVPAYPDLSAGLTGLLFPASGADFDLQKEGAFTPLLKNFTVITGGPGTGKTFTVFRMVSLFIDAFLKSGTPPVILAAAPTGKAAARMKESVNASLEKHGRLIPEHVKRYFPAEYSTIHRMLGYVDKSPYFRCNRENPLRVDLLIVDESSMIDLALMSKLFDALPDSARVVLLGDADQLSSVEAGSVFSDICGRGIKPLKSLSFASGMARLSGMTVPNCGSGEGGSQVADSIIRLEHSYRFSGSGGIGTGADMIKKGDSAALAEALISSPYPELVFYDYESGSTLEDILGRYTDEFFGEGFPPAGPDFFFHRFSASAVLSPLRHGKYGSLNINNLIENRLRKKFCINDSERFYHGKPLMIKRNNYQMNLFNGDVGFILKDGSSGFFQACFEGDGGTFRYIPAAMLPEFETAYAMTVHKSQGSEFDSVYLVLPRESSPLLSREMLYTAFTRAASSVHVAGSAPLIKEMVDNTGLSHSGLLQKLWPQI